METYYGYVRTPADAIKLFEACRMGLLPRVQRRLSEKERQSIRSGSVFVWDEREAGMRRWTDGKSWSASRVSGSFLTYREMEGKRGGGFGPSRRGSNKTPESGRGSDQDHDNDEPEGYRYKADGLMKQSFSITTSSGQHLHLISYYSRPQPGQSELPQPTSDVSLRHIVPVKGLYPESSMGETNQTPAMTRAPMQQPYMVPAPQPQHGQPYPHYSNPHPGYGWPPSPAQTPPYNHYTTTYQPAQPPPQQTLPPPSQSTSYPPRYESRPSISLPPPQITHGAPYQQQHYTYQPSARFPSPPLNPLREPLIADVRVMPGDLRGSQGPLPVLPAITGDLAGSSYPGEGRGRSTTPPRSSHSDNQPRTSLSSILHPENSEYTTSMAGGIGSSPRGGPSMSEGASEDTRALRMLNRSAFRHAAPTHA